MRFVVVHNHIYKNAGSSVDAVFKRAGFRQRAIEATLMHPTVMPAMISQAVAVDPALEYITSHSLGVPRPPDRDDLGYIDITFLRHPVDRLYSIYTYSRQPGVADFPDIPKEAPFADFVDALARTAPSHLHSPQTICLGNGRNFYFPPGEEELGRARETVSATRFLGIVDRFDESFRIFTACCGGLFGAKRARKLQGPFEAVNRSGDAPRGLEDRIAFIAAALGPERYRWVEAATACDLALYRFACEELTRRRRAVEG